jgi:hypothetical protein
MSDDRWLRELAQVNREMEAEEQDRLDDRWDRLSRGELSPEEESELRALAETSEEAREAWKAFRPLGADFQARVVRSIQSEIEAAKPPAKLLPFRKRPSRIAAWSAAAAAVAAMLFLLVRGPASYPPLPVYSADLSRGDQEFRGGASPSTGMPVFSPGSVLTLDAVPEQPVSGLVEARAFLARGGEIVPWEPAPPLAVVDGAVRLRGTLGREIQLPLGESRIWIVVARKGEIPLLDELARELRAGRTRRRDWQAVSADLRVEDRASP